MSNDIAVIDVLKGELLDLVAEEAMVPRETLVPEAALEELDIASADFVMILMAIEEKYGIYISVDNEMTDLKTVKDLLDMATRKIAEDKAE